jgi:hypothetical protein
MLAQLAAGPPEVAGDADYFEVLVYAQRMCEAAWADLISHHHRNHVRGVHRY